MFGNARRSITLLVSAIALAIPSAAWAAKLEGEYEGTGNSFFEKLSFRPGGKVRVTFMGMTKVGTYEIEDKEVLITVGNETNVFTLDDIASVISRETGRDVVYHRETLDEAYASRAGYGAPDWQVDAWVSTYTAIANGELAGVTDDVERLTGRKPMSLAELLRSG